MLHLENVSLNFTRCFQQVSSYCSLYTQKFNKLDTKIFLKNDSFEILSSSRIDRQTDRRGGGHSFVICSDNLFQQIRGLNKQIFCLSSLIASNNRNSEIDHYYLFYTKMWSIIFCVCINIYNIEKFARLIPGTRAELM